MEKVQNVILDVSAAKAAPSTVTMKPPASTNSMGEQLQEGTACTPCPGFSTNLTYTISQRNKSNLRILRLIPETHLDSFLSYIAHALLPKALIYNFLNTHTALRIPAYLEGRIICFNQRRK